MAPVSSILGRAAAWPASYVHRLPDDAFLHIEPGGTKDASGRTSPRSLRHLPVRDADGHLDLPHLRDALAQLAHAGPWLPEETRKALVEQATALHNDALATTHKAAKGLPDWALGYVAHLDRHEALGVPREDAHRAWPGDAKLAERAAAFLKSYRRPAALAKAAPSELERALRRKAPDFNARAGGRPGTRVTLKALSAVHARGAAAYDAAGRPTAKSRDQWATGRANTFLRLVATGKAAPAAYTADNDLLPAGHPRSAKKAAVTKPGTITPPKPPSKAPAPAATSARGAAARPPRGKARLPAAKATPSGEAPARTGSILPDIDMPWLWPDAVPEELDEIGWFPRHDAQLPRTAVSELGIAPSDRSGDIARKDELGSGDLAASDRLAPEQGIGDDALPGFDRRTFADIPIVVDRPKGTVQTGVGKDGTAWSRTYTHDYGFVPSTLGGDDEELDVFLGPDPGAPVAYVAVQRDDEGRFDEFKAFLGFPDADAARACYLAHIPERYLERFFEVPVSLLQALLGREPVEVLKATEPKRRSFGVDASGRVHVRWPTSSAVFSHEDEIGPESSRGPSSSPSAPANEAPPAGGSPAAVTAAAPIGVAPEATASVTALARKARRVAALATMGKVLEGPKYEGAKPLPREIADHPATTAEPTDTYTNPEEVGGWLYVIDGGDVPGGAPNWIAFVGVDGKALLWTQRDAEGGVIGVPYEFRRDDLIKPDANGRFPLRGLTAASKPPRMRQKGMPQDICPECGGKMTSAAVPEGTRWVCPTCGATFVDAPATAANINSGHAPFIAVSADDLEAAAKAARAVQGLLPEDPGVHARHVVPAPGEAAKDVDGGTMLFSPDSALDTSPEALAAFLASIKTPWLAEYPDSPRARLALAQAGPVFTHDDVPGSVFVASYAVAGDKVRKVDDGSMFGAASDTETAQAPRGADRDRGLPGELSHAVKKAHSKVILTIETTGVGYEHLKALLENIEKLGAPGHTFGIVADETTTGGELQPSSGKKIDLGSWDGDGGARVKIVNVQREETKEAAEARKAADLSFVAVGKADAQAAEQRFALGPVLIPNTVDLQGDTVSAEEIERAERAWMERYQNLGWQHAAAPGEIDAFRQADTDGKVPLVPSDKLVLVESYIVRDDRGGITLNGRAFPNGTWMLGVVYKDDSLWNEVKTGKRTGFSIGGFAKKEQLEAGGGPK